MKTRSNLWISGTAIQTPDRARIEILENSLFEIDADGTVASITPSSAPEYGDRLKRADADGGPAELRQGQYLLPGLVDLHIHAPQWPQLGKALHLPLEQWLTDYTFPLEARYGDLEFATAMYSSLVEALLANGTTTAVYFATVHLAASLRLAEICRDRGQRAFVGKVVMDDHAQCPTYYRDETTELALEETVAFIETVRASGDDLVQPIVTPRFIPSCTDAALAGLGNIAREHECHIQTHCSESDWEHGYVLERLGKTDSLALADFGLLTRHTILAHANHITSRDMDEIGGRGAGIAHCPLSNFYFSNAVFPLREALDKSLHVGLGTDISGGASASMLDSCRHAVLASRALEDGVDTARPAHERGRAGARINFIEAFWMATVGGGEALDRRIGKFAEGYQFDAMMIDTNLADSNILVWDDTDTPGDVLQKIVYGAGRSDIRKVWVDGRCVVDKDTA
jgi:guanine deaminase